MDSLCQQGQHLPADGASSRGALRRGRLAGRAPRCRCSQAQRFASTCALLGGGCGPPVAGLAHPSHPRAPAIAFLQRLGGWLLAQRCTGGTTPASPGLLLLLLRRCRLRRCWLGLLPLLCCPAALGGPGRCLVLLVRHTLAVAISSRVRSRLAGLLKQQQRSGHNMRL
jgi:hypothetical protein